MASARFCLAPTGAGHGKRNVLVSMLGCVPVTVTDFVFQPFEPEVRHLQPLSAVRSRRNQRRGLPRSGSPLSQRPVLTGPGASSVS